MTTIRVAVVQAEPAFIDLEGTLERADAWMDRAREAGAQLVAFPETWFAGYPAWLDSSSGAGLWDHEPAKEVYRRLVEQAVSVPGSAVDRLARAAKANGLTVVAGVNERVASGPGHRTLYNTILTFGPDGSLLNRHRKLVPTYTERMIWGAGDGAGLRAVDTPVGRVGGLICWEHWMPLARQVLHESGEDIHVALWPTVKEMSQVASQHYAFEGRCFVLAAGSLLRAGAFPEELPPDPEFAPTPDTLLLRGGSAIIGPNGRYLAGPVYDEETVLVADLDLDEIVKESMTLDVTGHYHRPDIFDVRLAQAPDGSH